MNAFAEFGKLFDGYMADYARHDGVGCASVFTSDAELHSPYGPPARGRAAIAETHRVWFEGGETNKTYALSYARANGDTGVCFLNFGADIPTSNGGSARVEGVSLSALERQSDKSWKIRLLSMNSLES